MRHVVLWMIVVFMIGCAPKPPKSTGPLVDTLIGKKIIFTDTPPDTPINTNQPPRRIAFTFSQDGYIQVDRMPTPREEFKVVKSGGDSFDAHLEKYVMDGLEVKVWRIEGRHLEIMTLFSFPKSNITKGDKVRSPKLAMGKEEVAMKLSANPFIQQSTNIWVYSIEPAK